MKDHPAVFTQAIVDVAKPWINPGDSVLDPFAGPATRFFTLEDLGATCFAVEIEHEWVSDHERHYCMDFFEFYKMCVDFGIMFDVVFVSPTFANRMADHHNAKDGSKRHTYKHTLGRDPSRGSSATMQWGAEYRNFNERAWNCIPGILISGGKFIVNVKNHIRKGVEIEVAEWHRDTILGYGFKLLKDNHVSAPGLRHGQNYDKRMPIEHVYVFEAP